MALGEVMQTERGFALLAVLMFMLFISGVTASFAFVSLQQSRLTAVHGDRFRARIGIDGFLKLYAVSLANRLEDPSARSMIAGETVRCHIDGIEHEASAINHAGLIDLNNADERMLVVGFLALGYRRQEAYEIAKLTALSRTPVLAITDDMAQHTMGRSLKFGLFESVAELADIVGNEKFDLAAALAIFTVHTRTASINAAQAPGPILVALDQLHDPAVVQWLQSRETSRFLTVTASRLGQERLQRTAVFDIASGMRAGISQVQYVDRISGLDGRAPKRRQVSCPVLLLR